MSTLVNRPASPMTTRAAEGLPRRRFTVAELEQMTAAGILAEDERIELIGGEVVPMAAKGSHHEVLKTALSIYWSRILPDNLLFTTETTFRLSADTYLEPETILPGHSIFVRRTPDRRRIARPDDRAAEELPALPQHRE